MAVNMCDAVLSDDSNHRVHWGELILAGLRLYKLPLKYVFRGEHAKVAKERFLVCGVRIQRCRCECRSNQKAGPLGGCQRLQPVWVGTKMDIRAVYRLDGGVGAEFGGR